MLKKLLATTAICSSIPFASYAADLPVKARPVPMVAAYNWTGFYVGGNIGYSWGRSHDTLDENFTGLGLAASERLKPSGVIGGVQAGYNWQMSRNWVWGLEADFQWSGQKDRLSRSVDFGPDSCGTNCIIGGSATGALETKLTWLGTARGRVGFVADTMPTVLWYATGGLAYGRVKTSGLATVSAGGINGIDCEGGCAFSANGSAAFSEAKTKVGWTLGAGVEGALGNDWTWKAEYLYVDLGTVSGIASVAGAFSCTGHCGSNISGPFSSSVTYSNKMTDNILRVGFNRRFAGP